MNCKKIMKKYLIIFALVLVISQARNEKILASSVIQIIGQPQSVSGEVYTPISMSVTASGENLSYQWEYYDVNSGSWKDYIGQTESVLNAPIYSDWNGLRLRCRVTDGANQVACSNEATVTIVKPLEITSQPNIGVEQLTKLVIPIPPIEKQKEIADKYKTVKDEITMLQLKLEKAKNRMAHIIEEGGANNA